MMKSTKIKIIYMIIAILIGIAFLFPLYWLLINSFKTDLEIFSGITFFPKKIFLSAWGDQLTSPDFLRSFLNSFTIAMMSMSISFMLGVPASYAMGRFDMKGKNVVLFTFLVTQMMPASLILTPLFLIYSKVGLLNTHIAPALSIAAGSIPFIVITLRPYFLQIPKSLDDAARIDGCNAFTSFLLIMLPVIRTGLITIVVISFLHGWNDLLYSMTFNVKEVMRPLTANVYKYISKYGMKWNYIMAYGMILVTPVTLLFIFLQKYIVNGLSSGAVKE